MKTGQSLKTGSVNGPYQVDEMDLGLWSKIIQNWLGLNN